MDILFCRFQEVHGSRPVIVTCAGSRSENCDARLAHPLGVGLLRRDLALDLLVLDDAALLEVDEEDLAGLQAAEAHDVRRGGSRASPASEPRIT